MNSVSHYLRTEGVLNGGYSFHMTICQTITLDYDDEMKNTRKLLERVPLDDAHRVFRPHEKSMPLEALASHVAELPSWLKLALESEVFELQPDFRQTIAGSTQELLALFDKSVAEGRAAIDHASDGEMKKIWSFKFAGQVAYSDVRTKVIRS